MKLPMYEFGPESHNNHRDFLYYAGWDIMPSSAATIFQTIYDCFYFVLVNSVKYYLRIAGIQLNSI